MSLLKRLNQSLHAPVLIDLQVTIKTKSGDTKTQALKVRKNKLSSVAGSGLSTAQLYELIKTGKTTSTDQNEAVYNWEILQQEESSGDLTTVDSPVSEAETSLESVAASSEQT